MNHKGVSLLEVILAVALMSSAVATITVFFPKATLLVTQAKLRSTANLLASAKMSEYKEKSYAFVRLTPRSLFPVSNPNCRCEDLTDNDFRSNVYPFEDLKSGAMTFSRRVCVNKVDDAGNTFCPNDGPDQGLKKIIVRVDWVLGETPYKMELESMVYRPTPSSLQQGTFNVLPCIAQANNPAACDYSRNNELVGTQITISKGMTQPWKDIPSSPPPILNTPYPAVSFTVKAGTNYTVHAQKPGFFPFHLSGLAVAGGQSVNVNALLKRISSYGSQAAGEVSVADHPVISRVVSEITFRPNATTNPNGDAQCPDATEMVELYNPTESTYTFRCNSGFNCLQLRFVMSSPSLGSGSDSGPLDLSAAQGFNVPTGMSDPPKLYPKRYLILKGVDDTNYPSDYDRNWMRPDAYYSLSAVGGVADKHDGLVTRHGGGIVLYLSGRAVDSVRWHGSPSTTINVWGSIEPAPNTGGVPWTDSDPLPQGNVQGKLCTKRFP